jgi:hypothetical protein
MSLVDLSDGKLVVALDLKSCAPPPTRPKWPDQFFLPMSSKIHDCPRVRASRESAESRRRSLTRVEPTRRPISWPRRASLGQRTRRCGSRPSEGSDCLRGRRILNDLGVRVCQIPHLIRIASFEPEIVRSKVTDIERLRYLEMTEAFGGVSMGIREYVAIPW